MPKVNIKWFHSTKVIRLIFSIILFCMVGLSFPIQVGALYDQVALDISVTEESIGFSFTSDGNLSARTPLNLYIAALLGTDIYFLNRNSEPFGLEAFTPGVEPSPFVSSALENSGAFVAPLALSTSDDGTPAPFDISTLNGIRLFAGFGSSVTDFLSKGNFVQFYTGEMPTLPQPKRKWSVMVYMVGSTLESGNKNASKDILQMISGSLGLSEELVNVVVTTGGSKRNGWKHVKRSLIHGGQLYPIEDLGYDKESINMGNSEVLSDFVEWTKANFEADHYALVLWGHGKGAEGGIGPDDNANKRLDIPGLDAAFKTIQEANNRSDQKALDAVLYDACLMGTIEVAQITSQVTDIMGASADTEPGTGMDYNALLQGIASRNIVTGIDFSNNAMDAYIQECDQNNKFQGGETVITYSVLDLSKIEGFNTKMATFAKALKTVITESYFSYTKFSRALIRTVSYPKNGGVVRNHEGWQHSQDHHLVVDLVGFLENIGEVISDLEDQTTALADFILGAPKTDGSGFDGGLAAAYRGNLDQIQGIGDKVGRLSINIGKQNDYIREDGPPLVRYLPELYDDINEAMNTYFTKRGDDFSSLETSPMCDDGTLACAGPNWFKIPESQAEELLSISALKCRSVTEGGDIDDSLHENDVLSIHTFYNGEELEENLEFTVQREEMCIYSICADERCEWITVSENQGMLTAEADINGIPSILTFTADGDNQWKVAQVMKYENETWGRGEALSYGETITPTQSRIVDGALQSVAATVSLPINDEQSVYLERKCSIDSATLWTSYFGFNFKADLENVCDATSCYTNDDGEESYPGIRIEVE